MRNNTVKSGDSMWKIAQRNNPSLAELERANSRTKNPETPEAGARSRVPGSSDGFEAARSARSSRTVHLDPKPSSNVYGDIEKVFGAHSVEVPDHGPSDKHIRVVDDPQVGKAYEFRLNRDADKDPLGHPNRQRCEIKVGPHAPPELKASEGKSFTYKWRFRLSDDMQVSHSFTHFFQLKGSGGNDSMPLVTLSGAKTGHGDKLQVRYSKDGEDGAVLAEHDLKDVRGKWVEATVSVENSKKGKLQMDLKTLDGKPVLHVDRSNIDLIRNCDFVRPKWGFYRGLAHKDELKPGNSTVRFAGFSVTPGFKGARPGSGDGYEPGSKPGHAHGGGKVPTSGGPVPGDGKGKHFQIGKVSVSSNDPSYGPEQVRADLRKLMKHEGDAGRLGKKEDETVAAIMDCASRYYPDLPARKACHLIMADIKAESDFDPNCKSPGSDGPAYGLMQVTPGTKELELWKKHSNLDGVQDWGTGKPVKEALGGISNSDLRDPWVNLHVACWIQSNLARSGGADPDSWGRYNYKKETTMKTAFGSWVAGPAEDPGCYGSKGDDLSGPYFKNIGEALHYLGDSRDLSSYALKPGVIAYHH